MIATGLYLNELVKHAHPNHLSVGQLIEERFNKPLGLDIHLGLPEDREGLFSPVVRYPKWQMLLRVLPRLYFEVPFAEPIHDRNALRGAANNSIVKKAFDMLKAPAPILTEWIHTREYRSCELPAANAFTHALDLAKLAQIMALGGSGTVDGHEHHLLSASTWREAHRFYDTEFDLTILHNITRTVAGFAQMAGLHPLMQGAIGWVGVGGSMMVWNPSRQLSFAYVPKAHGHSFVVDKRAAYLYDAILNTL